MMQKGKFAAALLGGCLAIFISLCSAEPKSPDLKVNPEVKAARELLNSWNGRPQVLEQAREKITHVLDGTPQDYFALKELARYQIMAGYINSRYETYQRHIYTVGNYTPGSIERAEETVRNAIRINPRFAEGYVLLGYIQFEQTRLDEAAKTLAYAEELGTDDPWLQLNWASVNNARGEYSAANKRVERVLESGTSNSKAIAAAYESLIEGYERTKERDKVVALYEKQIKQRPNDAWLRGNFAAYLTDTLGRNDEAITQARAALQIMDYGVGKRTLAMALYRKWADMVVQGKARDGEKYFQEAFEIFPQLTEVMAYGASEPAGEHLAKALIAKKRVSVDARAEDGSTALLIAINRNRVNVVQMLLNLRANPNASDVNGWTPLLSAADEGSAEIVSMLLAKGADVHMRAPWNGGDAAFFAERNGNVELAAMLRKRAANLK